MNYKVRANLYQQMKTVPGNINLIFHTSRLCSNVQVITDLDHFFSRLIKTYNNFRFQNKDVGISSTKTVHINL